MPAAAYAMSCFSLTPLSIRRLRPMPMPLLRRYGHVFFFFFDVDARYAMTLPVTAPLTPPMPALLPPCLFADDAEMPCLRQARYHADYATPPLPLC